MIAAWAIAKAAKIGICARPIAMERAVSSGRLGFSNIGVRDIVCPNRKARMAA